MTCFLVASWSPSFAQQPIDDRLRAHVGRLAADTLNGRAAGSMDELGAALYIMGMLAEDGISTTRLPFMVCPQQGDTLRCHNLSASIGRGADSTIVFCAHYDHLGMGSGKSKEIVKKCVHPGADDNASGVAVLLELARQLVQDSTSARFNYLFLFPSAHEIGLYGSKSVVQSRLLDTLNIRAVINLDMVGRMDAREHRVRVNHCFKGIDFIFNDRAPDAVRITTEDASMITNDLTIFCEAGLPAMSITTGLHQDYHRCSDTADKLNYAGMVEIKDMLIHMLKKL
jgi:aminopeptidase-like protein